MAITNLSQYGYIKSPVRTVATSNVTISSPGSSIGGATLSSGDANKRVLLAGQSSASENGLYDWNGAASAMTRAVDANLSAMFIPGFVVAVLDGTSAGAVYQYQGAASPTLGSTSLTFTRTNPAATTPTITVRDIDGTPTIAASTIEFTNGTVSDQSGGVARVTIAGNLTVAEIDGTPSVSASTLQLPNGTVTDIGGGVARYTPATPTITVKDIDGTPSISATTIEFTNGTVTDQTGGVARVTISGGGSVTVKEEDGTPSVAATEIKFPNGSLTDNGGGSVSVAFPSGSSDFAISISNPTIPTVTGGVLTGFSWRNQGACTATDRSPVGASFEYPGGSGDSIRGMDKTAGSTIAEMWFRRLHASGASRVFLYARSSGGAYRTIGINSSGNLVVEAWTSDTGYTGTTGTSVTLTLNGLLVGVRFTISGGNIDASYSLDGVYWFPLATGISFTPAQFGAGIWSNGVTYFGIYSFYTA